MVWNMDNIYQTVHVFLPGVSMSIITTRYYAHYEHCPGLERGTPWVVTTLFGASRSATNVKKQRTVRRSKDPVSIRPLVYVLTCFVALEQCP